MRKKIQRIITHPLISGSTALFVGTNAANVFNFFYNLFMLRNLSSVDYGVLLSMISLITVFAYLADSLTPFIVNFAAQYFGSDRLGQAKTLFLKITKGSIVVGLTIVILFILFSKQIGSFLKIDDQALIVTVGVCILFGFVGIVNKAFLQAKLAFRYIAFLAFVGSFFKFILGVFFVFNGFRVAGALYAFMIAFLGPYILSFIPLRKMLHRDQKKETIELKKMMRFGFGSIIAMFSLAAFITTDVLLVKHFFTPQLAGLYAGITIVGKIIFFFSAPIGLVMFPLVVQKYAKKQNYHNDFRLAFSLVLLPSLALIALYFLFPQMIVHFIMKREEYLSGIEYIGPMGIFFSLYSLIYVMTNFFLSIQKTNVYIPILGFAIAQGLLMWFFHNSLMQILSISIMVLGLLLATLLLYYVKISSTKIKNTV